MRDIILATEEIYHLCNKAVDNKPIFSSARECQYFLETAFLVNTTDKRLLDWRRGHLRSSGKVVSEHYEPLVEIYALSLMPDHFHIVVKQLIDNGIAYFCHRLCNSFARAYNIVHKRKGRLFVGSYRAVHLQSDAQAAHIFTYVHGNPLDVIDLGWRSGEIKNWKKARAFLQNYLWSSLGVYAGTGADPLLEKIINKDFARDYFSNSEDYYESIRDWSTRGEQWEVDTNLLE